MNNRLNSAWISHKNVALTESLCNPCCLVCHYQPLIKAFRYHHLIFPVWCCQKAWNEIQVLSKYHAECLCTFFFFFFFFKLMHSMECVCCRLAVHHISLSECQAADNSLQLIDSWVNAPLGPVLFSYMSSQALCFLYLAHYNVLTNQLLRA